MAERGSDQETSFVPSRTDQEISFCGDRHGTPKVSLIVKWSKLRCGGSKPKD